MHGIMLVYDNNIMEDGELAGLFKAFRQKRVEVPLLGLQMV